MSKSKIFMRVLAFLIICIPLYLAIYSIVAISSDGLIIENVTQVTVICADGKEIIYDKKADVRNFIGAVNDAIAVDRQAESYITDKTPAVLQFFVLGKPVEYQLFLSLNPKECVIRNAEGELSNIQSKSATFLLSEPISDYLFEYNRIPAANVPQGDQNVIKVYAAEGGVWKLRKIDGKFHETSIIGSAAETNEIKISRNYPFSINFDVEPDIITIEVYDNKEQLFNGLLEQFDDFQVSNFNYEQRKELQFVLKAEWIETDAYYHGTAEYHLNVIYEVPAAFDISNHQAEQGDLIVVTAFNVGEKDALTLSCPELEYETTFVQSGANKLALLPIGLDFTGVLNLNITGDYPESFQVTVNSKDSSATVNYSAKDENIAAHLSANAKLEKQNKYNEIFSQASSEQKLWEDNFINPNTSGTVLLEYGKNVTINKGSGYVNQGVNLAVADKDPVLAANAGRVIFIGRIPDDGNLVVIDHGAGLRTWYAHLDSINVQENETVTTGQEIGFAGKTGMFTSLNINLYFAVSVQDVFINPVNLLKNGITAGSASSSIILPDVPASDAPAPSVDEDSELPEAVG